MAYAIVDVGQLDAGLTTVADAIRSKTGGAEPLSFPDGMAAAIGNLSDADAADIEAINKQLSDTIGTDGATLQENADRLDALNAELERTLYGTDTGGKSQYDAFWDDYLNYSGYSSLAYRFAGKGWNDETFYPPRGTVISVVNQSSKSVSGMFMASGITDLKSRCQELGVTIDLSEATSFSQFLGDSSITAFPTLDTRGAESLANILYAPQKLVSIEKMILKEDGSQTFNANSFYMCGALRDIPLDGVIGVGVDLHWSALLSKTSLTSIINALSGEASGMTVTLSIAAVNNAFETATGAADGATSAEWLALADTKSNWTISLV